jgi:hydroxymethylpyrimidine/phosphomethylpyrimidine kinase
MSALPDNMIVLTIAGFDPSGCAGVLADIKTFEANGVHGMAVCTANTIQNVGSFKKANWIKQEEIISQLNLLQQEVHFEFVKIGLIESFELLDSLVDELISRNPSVKIIWDPVCKASAQFVFHTAIEKKLLETVCTKLYLITPNLEEQAILVPGMETEEAGRYFAQFCNALIKGGHGETSSATDSLFTKAGVYYLEAERLSDFSKRGTGCVLSSAILASLAKGESLLQSCVNGKRYVHHYLTSNHSLVGMHNYENQ